MSELEPFRMFLIELLTEARETATRATNNTVRAALESNVSLLERIAMFISKSKQLGEIDMEKAKSEIKVLDQGTIEELGRARRESPVTSKIIDLANDLKPGRYVQVDPKGIEPTHFSTRVYNLRAQGAIPHDVKPKNNVNGTDGLFLVKLTKEQMSAEPKRRAKATNGN